ncbi:DrmB family protein [Crossiella sp. NPDC003009]
MTGSRDPQQLRVGGLRPNQLLHTYGVGAVADLPNLSVVMLGLDQWDPQYSRTVVEDRLLAAVQVKLGQQVEALRIPPHLEETPDPFGDWSRVGVPVGLFPGWLRCSNTSCNRLGRADSGMFDFIPDPVSADRTRFGHRCRGGRGSKPATAVPARFVLACANGHLDDFPWSYFVHQDDSGNSHVLRLSERGSTGEASDVIVSCEECEEPKHRGMEQAFGTNAAENLPACRGRHPHLGAFDACSEPVRTMVLGATNSWFPMQLRAFTLPRDRDPVDHLIAHHWQRIEVLSKLDGDVAKQILPTQFFWPELEPHGVDKAWEAIERYAGGDADDAEEFGATKLLRPEWRAFTDSVGLEHDHFTTRGEPVPKGMGRWLERVVLATRLREVAALYGFTRIDAPEFEVSNTQDDRQVRLSQARPTWAPCAELRGEGIFLKFTETAIAEWEQRATVLRRRQDVLLPGHRKWREQRRLPSGRFPDLRYLLLHTFAHVLIREFALESGYSAAGIGERIYAEEGAHPMAGVLLYTAAPDSEGTLGGLVALGETEQLGQLIGRALESAELCSSDPLCAEHDPTVHGRLYGAACHACLFASETSCERGNQYLDRALLVDTLAGHGCGFFHA